MDALLLIRPPSSAHCGSALAVGLALAEREPTCAAEADGSTGKYSGVACEGMPKGNMHGLGYHLVWREQYNGPIGANGFPVQLRPLVIASIL